MAAMEKFKQKYGITTTKELVIIFLTYSLAGSGVGFVVRSILRTLFHAHHVPRWEYILTYVCFALPAYQTLLLILGFLFGQGKFFWGRFLKLQAALGRFFRARAEGLVASFQSQENT